MKLELTASNGKKYTFENFGKNGDFITVVLVNEFGKEKTYFIRITPKGGIFLG